MKKKKINIESFFILLRAGLWEKEVRLSQFEKIDFDEIYRLAEEQSVVGLLAAGLEHLEDLKVPQEIALQFVSPTLQMEQRNQAMNAFVGKLVDKMRAVSIYTLLLKGQGVAQCYERPLWRSCGDVDLFLSDSNYESAKKYLIPLASSVAPEGEYKKHLGLTIDSWSVELHGNMRCGLSDKMDKGIDEVQKAVFNGGDVRSWMNGNTQVFVPGEDSDALFLFTHFLKHFYTGGLGLRQICDWCRLLWSYRETIKKPLLESRLRKMGLMTEWKAFGAFAVDYLGMPAEAMPFYSSSWRWSWKAKRICSFVMEVGNMGHNRDKRYFAKPYLVRKSYSLGRRIADLIRHFRIFPMDSIRFFPSIMLHGLKSAAKGE